MCEPRTVAVILRCYYFSTAPTSRDRPTASQQSQYRKIEKEGNFSSEATFFNRFRLQHLQSFLVPFSPPVLTRRARNINIPFKVTLYQSEISIFVSLHTIEVSLDKKTKQKQKNVTHSNAYAVVVCDCVWNNCSYSLHLSVLRLEVDQFRQTFLNVCVRLVCFRTQINCVRTNSEMKEETVLWKTYTRIQWAEWDRGKRACMGNSNH